MLAPTRQRGEPPWLDILDHSELISKVWYPTSSTSIVALVSQRRTTHPIISSVKRISLLITLYTLPETAKSRIRIPTSMPHSCHSQPTSIRLPKALFMTRPTNLHPPSPAHHPPYHAPNNVPFLAPPSSHAMHPSRPSRPYLHPKATPLPAQNTHFPTPR